MDGPNKIAGRVARLMPATLVASMLLAACGGAATPTPTTEVMQPTATTAAMMEATATTGVMMEPTSTTAAMMEPTATTGGMMEATATTGAMMEGTPGAGGMMMVPEGPGEVTLWHGYTGAEADTLQEAVNTLQQKNPDFKVNLLAVPFDQLKNKYSTEASTGGGPDLVIGPSDWIGDYAEANVIQPYDGMAGVSDITGMLVPSAVEVAKYNGKLYGIPSNTKNVALYYNKDLVKDLPKNTDDLLAMASKLATGNVKYGAALNAGFYHAVGYNFAFGGKLFTDPTHIDLTTQGTVDWLNWMKKAKDTPGVFIKNGADDDINNLFTSGQAAMVINGPWALGDYRKALGADKVGVAVAPDTATGGKFAPFVGTENYYLNPNSKNQKAALAFVDYIVSPGVQQIFVDKAGQVSTNTKVDLSSNPDLKAFAEQAKQGTPFPTYPAMGKVWDPAGNMINEVLDGKAQPAEAAKQANDAINSAITK